MRIHDASLERPADWKEDSPGGEEDEQAERNPVTSTGFVDDDVSGELAVDVFVGTAQ